MKKKALMFMTLAFSAALAMGVSGRASAQEPTPTPMDQDSQNPPGSQQPYTYGSDTTQQPDTYGTDTQSPDTHRHAGMGSRREEGLQSKRVLIDQKTQEAIDRLSRESSQAKVLYDKAYGYAVFTDAKVSLGLSGSGGAGEAVIKNTGRKTYMRMAGAGVGIGAGAQKYQVVFLFEDANSFNNFVEKGWKAEASANAALGRSGANSQTAFTNGMAVYTLTEGGLMLQADISGTKYWKSDKLNAGMDENQTQNEQRIR